MQMMLEVSCLLPPTSMLFAYWLGRRLETRSPCPEDLLFPRARL